MMQIISFLKLSISASNSNALVQEGIEATESAVLDSLAKNEFTYSESYATTDESRILRKLPANYYKMFTMLARRAGPPKYQCEEGKRVIELRRFDTTDKIRAPEKWLDYVIFYSLEERKIPIKDDNLFIGIALYAQDIPMEYSYSDILVENLFRLYIKPVIINNPKAFHNKIYKDENGNLRDKPELAFLENIMKTMLIRVLDILGMPFGISDRRNLTTYASGSYSSLDDWCKKRAIRLVAPRSNPTDFKNIIMRSAHLEKYDGEGYTTILLVLIGMIRSGRHTVSLGCINWLDTAKRFQDVIDMVNTNNNLVGITELESDMDLEGMLGSIKKQLWYIEMKFRGNYAINSRALTFLKSIKPSLEMKATLAIYNRELINGLLLAPNIFKIKRLRLEDASGLLANQNTMRFVAWSKKVKSLELLNCGVTLEEFIAKGYFMRLKRKLKVLGVAGVSISDLNEREINREALRELLSESVLERLHITITEGDSLASLNQLIHMVTTENFKYLVFSNEISDNYEDYLAPSDLRKECVAKIVDMKGRLKRMRFKRWPVIITKFMPTELAENDYSIIMNSFYEIHL